MKKEDDMVDRKIEIFQTEFDDSDTQTDFKCPCCNKGTLVLKKDSYIKRQYKSSEKAIEKMVSRTSGYDAWDYIATISGVLQCNHLNCQEYVSFVGKLQGDEREVYVEEIKTEMPCDIYILSFIYLNPPVHIISINNSYPKVIKKLLEESFSLYWNHKSLCINKLRILIEEIMNNLKVQKKAKIKNGKNAGKYKSLTLHDRIGYLKKDIKYIKSSDFLLALKWIGNEGSHTNNSIEYKDIDFTYKMLDKALDLIYIGRDKTLLKKVKEINKNKGLKK